MRTHPAPHHPTLSSFLGSPSIHFIHKIIPKSTAFDPCSRRLPQRAVGIVHLEYIYILVDECSLCLNAEQISLERRVIVRRRCQLAMFIRKGRPIMATF